MTRTSNQVTKVWTPPVVGVLDHFKCYKTKQLRTRFDPRQVVLTDQFNEERVNVVRNTNRLRAALMQVRPSPIRGLEP